MNAISRFWLKMRKRMGSPKLLCDSCKYDYDGACRNSVRPNATACDDYRKR